MPPSISLLWPSGVSGRPAADRGHWLEGSPAALGLESLVTSLSLDFPHRRFLEEVLLDLCDDAQVITYRLAVLDDLLQVDGLAPQLEALLPELEELQRPSYRSLDESVFYQTVWRLAELEAFVGCVRKLHAALSAGGDGLRSAGLQQLRTRLDDIQADPVFRALEQQLPELAARIRGVQSVTLGVNLDGHLRPVEATLLAVNDRKFRGESLLSRLFGRAADDRAGIAPLHAATPQGVARLIPGTLETTAQPANPLMVPLFHDLEGVLSDIARPIADALGQYRSLTIQPLIDLGPEVAFYLGAARLIRRLRASGLPMCRPEVAPRDERAADIQGLYNINLALRLHQPDQDLGAVVVRSDVNFGPQSRIGILTGPNRGGKTTYTQAIGLAQVLFQAGLYVPAQSARLSPADAIYLHFITEEKLHLDTGRLGEEAHRVSEIFRYATRHSLVLFNESFSSTAPGEGLYIARDVVRGFCLLGVRGIFATHFHELAAAVDQINAEVPGDTRVISLIAGAIPSDGGRETQRTFQIRPGPPMGTSFAKEIAMRHGISFEQIAQTLRERGALDAPQAGPA